MYVCSTYSTVQYSYNLICDFIFLCSFIHSFIHSFIAFLFVHCRQLGIKECEDDDKDDLHATAFAPPTNYIKISQGKIQLVHQPPPPPLSFVTAPTPTTTPTSATATLPSKGTATTNGYHQHHHQNQHNPCNNGGVIESPRDKVSSCCYFVIRLSVYMTDCLSVCQSVCILTWP